MTGGERRQSIRMGLALPMRVQGFEADGSTWEEATTTDDISEGGCSFPVSRRVELGQVLLLFLPFPKRLRQYDPNESAYRVYALVRGLVHRPDRPRVGVMLFGKYPPRGFEEKPSRRYLLPSDLPPPLDGPGSPDRAASAPDMPSPPPHPVATAPERRSSARFHRLVDFTLQQVDEWGAVLQEELTVADNLAKGGAHVLTSLEFMKGDVVLLRQAGGDFETRAEVRDVLTGEDGLRRLHLKFLDREAPDGLLRPL
ncbi:MAG TPA: PilZ domain-containing protein [Vicinamibacteria bacterium]|nr:PilZ domain-containing protein [Vicinamibacteria bacterium]